MELFHRAATNGSLVFRRAERTAHRLASEEAIMKYQASLHAVLQKSQIIY
jgi:hypothetical protein